MATKLRLTSLGRGSIRGPHSSTNPYIPMVCGPVRINIIKMSIKKRLYYVLKIIKTIMYSIMNIIGRFFLSN